MSEPTLVQKLEPLHKWSKKKTLRYESEHWLTGAPEVDEFEGRECTVCHAIDVYGYAQYHSCHIMTGYPADEAPCLCTRKQYADAHGVKI